MEKKSLKLITFNTLGIPFLTTHRHKNYLAISRNLVARFRYIGDTLNTSNADIILLQEVHLFSLLRLLKKRLSNYPYVYYQRFLYGPKGGLVVFSKHELVLEPFFNFSGRGSIKNKTVVTKIIRNGALVCRMKDLPLSIINTYITGNFSHKWEVESKYTKVQQLQLTELQEKIIQLQADHCDVIVGGDMNIIPGASLYKQFVQKLTMRDFFVDSTTPTHHLDFLPKWVSAPRLDHILMTSQYIHPQDIQTEELFTKKVVLSNDRESFISDHIALSVSFTLSL